MTFAFDLAPLIETGGFIPETIAVPEAGAATLDAALREAARAEHADAILADLWLDRPGGANWRVGTSPLAWAAAEDGDGVLDLGGGKQAPLSAAFGEPVDGDDEEEEEEEILVNGIRPEEPTTGGGATSGSGEGSGHEGNEGSGDGGGEPNCGNSNEITGKEAPDGAGKYYAPEGVDAAYLNGALAHIAGISNNNPLNKLAVMQEIIAMYTDKSHPYFADFKDWGTNRGPDGSIGVPGTYFSQEAGREVGGSLFEPFGNYFFGMLCTYGGLSPEEIYAAAAWYSESGPFWEGDDPQDIPHIQLGIADAKRQIDAQTPGIPNPPPIEVNDQCGS
jgi:hypothetical protein